MRSLFLPATVAPHCAAMGNRVHLKAKLLEEVLNSASVLAAVQVATGRRGNKGEGAESANDATQARDKQQARMTAAAASSIVIHARRTAE